MVLLLGATLTKAAMVVTLFTSGGSSGDDIYSTTTFTYTNLQGTPTFNGGNLNASATLTSNSIAAASGSFTVTWTPIGATNLNNVSTWTFVNTNTIQTITAGWGVLSGTARIQTNEFMLLTFNTSNLTVNSGYTLAFSVLSEDETNNPADSMSVYQRTGANSGALIETTPGAAPAVWSPNIPVQGLQQYAVAAIASTIKSFRVDVIPTSATVPNVVGLSQATALSAITSAGLVSGTVTQSYSETVAGGNVINQNPASGSTVAYQSAVDFSVSIGPSPKLLQYLNATNAASVVTSGNTVTQWNDLTTNGNNAVAYAGTVQYPGTNLSATGLSGLNFGAGYNSLQLFSSAASAGWLNQTSTTNGGFCVLVAIKCNSLVAGVTNQVIGNTTNPAPGLFIGYTASGQIQASLGGVPMVTSGRTVSAGETIIFTLNYDASSNTCTFWDSKNSATVTATVPHADFSLPNSVLLGGNFNGMVGEVKIFNRNWRQSDLEAQRVAMVQKWIKRPNIVLIYVDDWPWCGTPMRMDPRMRNSAMPNLEMPNLEVLARQGMTFRNSYGSPQCSPARAALQTGQSNARNGYTIEMNGDGLNYYDQNSLNGGIYSQFPVLANGSDENLRSNAVTIAQALAPYGYRSALFGKWHLNDDPTIHGYYAPDGNTDPKSGNTIPDTQTTLDGITDPKKMNNITTNGLAFMQQAVTDGVPFFLELSHYAMHDGHECFPSSRARYQNLSGVVAYNNGQTNPANINRKNDPAVWLGMAYDLDKKIGEVMQKLVDLGITNNTYVVCQGDNGYREDFYNNLSGLTNQPLHGGKWWVWQAGIRVPMFAAGPGIPTNSVTTVNVVNYDFFPTFLDWAGGDPTLMTNLDGKSLTGLMKGQTPSAELLNRSLYFHMPHYRMEIPQSAIIKGHYKLVYCYETTVIHPGWEPIMLFDLNNDAGEYINIFPQNPALAQSLYADMTNYLTSVGARFPLVPNPNYNPTAESADTTVTGRQRLMWGPFLGTRTNEVDELGGPISFVNYWLDSFGVNLGSVTNDYDHDGVVNLAEYAVGGNPTNSSDAGVKPVFNLSAGNFQFVYPKRSDDSSLIYSVETTTNLASKTWTNSGSTIIGTNVTGSVLNYVTNTVPANNQEGYLRLKVSSQ